MRKLLFRSMLAALGVIGTLTPASVARAEETLSISNNRIDGNLQCKKNSPPPTGGGNIVQGNKEDQCSRL